MLHLSPQRKELKDQRRRHMAHGGGEEVSGEEEDAMDDCGGHHVHGREAVAWILDRRGLDGLEELVQTFRAG